MAIKSVPQVRHRRSRARNPLVDILIHSHRAVPWLAGFTVLAALILATGSLLTLSPVAWVALLAVAPVTVVLVQQIQAAFAER